MVIDSSAVLAILLQETEALAFSDAIEADPVRLMSAGSVLEAGMVIEAKRGPAGERDLDLLLQRAAVEVVPFNAAKASLARHAFRTFGKGLRRAGLNFRDCMAYALSKSSGEPLLFKGQDFTATDIVAC